MILQPMLRNRGSKKFTVKKNKFNFDKFVDKT